MKIKNNIRVPFFSILTLKPHAGVPKIKGGLSPGTKKFWRKKTAKHKSETDYSGIYFQLLKPPFLSMLTITNKTFIKQTTT